MPNKYTCSNGEKVTEATIKARLSKCYREMYADNPSPVCDGCGKVIAQGSAHIIPKAILKTLHLTDLIWNPIVIFPACHCCNTICENVSSTEITKLLNYDIIKEVLIKYCPERASKLPE